MEALREAGEYATFAEPADREGITQSCMTRLLRLTLLAPVIAEAILSGQQGLEVTVAKVLQPFPDAWKEPNFGGYGVVIFF